MKIIQTLVKKRKEIWYHSLDSHSPNVINFSDRDIENDFSNTNFSFIENYFVHSIRTSSSFNLKISIHTGYSSYDVPVCIDEWDPYSFKDFSGVRIDVCSRDSGLLCGLWDLPEWCQLIIVI